MLPIEPDMPRILAALEAQPNLVLIAPPGAGKTTRMPLALLDAAWAQGQKIIIVEPRRVAARGAARRMAATLGEEVGQTIGWRMRLDTKVGPHTRIEVITDGLLTRRLQSDPELTGIAAVLFDEFHERRLESDLGLALALEAQAALRPDLRLVVMSATLSGERLGPLMGAEVIETQGRAFPIDIRYRPPARRHIAEDVADCVRESLGADQGDILVFLPGAGEIERARRALGSLSAGVSLHILHGDLSAEAQDRALRPDPAGGRKIILSTAIAETSLTIEGVKVVIDSGLMRVARFDQNSGMDRLETVTVTLSSATQRAGRAGRLGPGICYRLWPEAETRGLLTQAAPELLEADLSPLALELAQWGAKDASQLAFLDPPPAAHFAAATDLLRSLDLIDAQGAITDHGRQCGSMGLHPRLSHMIIMGRARGLGSMAAYLAALLSDRDPLRGAGADAVLRLEALMGGQARSHLGDSASLARIARLAKTWIARGSSDHKGAIDPLDVGILIALAYPDRVAARRAGSQTSFRLVNGRGAEIDTSDSLARCDFLAIADLDGPARGAKIRLAAPLSLEKIDDLFGPSIETRRTCQWDSRQEAVTSRIQRRLSQLVLEDRPDQAADPDDVRAALMAGIRAMGLEVLPWEPRATQLVARARLVARHAPDADVPDLSAPALISGLEDWLGPDLDGRTRRSHLKDIDLAQALKRLFNYGQMRVLDRLAPEDWQAPTGSTITLDYTQGDLPVLAVRLQEVFGLSDTPRICDGRLGVLLHLLSPAHRPVQVTADLAGFWRGSYSAVRADLRGRYPKHAWPDDPANAAPLRGTKKRG